MKKIISAIIVMVIIILSFWGYTNKQVFLTIKTPKEQISKQVQKKEFEKRLNLTDLQKAEAKEIHQKALLQMKPIMLKISLKEQELENLKYLELPENEQQKRSSEISLEIKELKKQARQIKKENFHEFEQILTKEQKAEFELLKHEGRLKFKKRQHEKGYFGYINTHSTNNLNKNNPKF